MENTVIRTIPPMNTQPTFDQAMVQCASALLNDKDFDQALENLVQVTAAFYQGTRTYLLDYSEKTHNFQGICQCFSPELALQEHLPLPLPQVSPDFLGQWQPDLNSGLEIFLPDVAQDIPPGKPVGDYLQQNQVNSLLIAPVKRGEHYLAMVVVENPQVDLSHLRLIRSVVVFVEVCIGKRDMMEQLEQIHQKKNQKKGPITPICPHSHDVHDPWDIPFDPAFSVQEDLLAAIEDKEFQIYFQPKVQLTDGKVVGAEALVRRKISREDALVYPDIFVKIYEEQAIIRHLDLYVVERACQTLAQWQAEGVAIPISVNFSRVTLTEYGIMDTVKEICLRHGVPHHLLIIEFTERIAMMNETAYYNLAVQFQEEGFQLSLDDFGAAYSNLITLAKIDVNEIKIDKTLIRNMEYDRKNQIVLKSIIRLCNAIENTIPLAEGIETQYQADKLLEFGCVYGQGNLFSPPIEGKDFYRKFLVPKS